MKEAKNFSKVFLLLFICTAFIALFSYGGAIAMETVFPKKIFYPPGTMIANLEIGDLTVEEAEPKLIEEVEKWKNETSLKFIYFDEMVEIELAKVEFLISESLQLAQKGYGELITNLPKDLLIDAIGTFSYPIPMEELDLDAITERVSNHAMSLATQPLYIDINEFIENKANRAEIVATVQISNLGSTLQLSEWSSKLDGFVIEAEETFSLLKAMEAVGTLPSEGESLNSLATILYQLFLETNFQIIERHAGLSAPSFTEVGFNAVVSEQSADFIVRNKNYYPYTLKLDFQNNELKASLTGLAFPYQYTATIKDEKVIEPRKIVHFSATRRIGDKQVINNGEKGFFVEVYRQVRNRRTKQLLSEQFLFEDFYPPVHQVEEWSLKERIVAELPEEGFEEKVEENSDNNVDAEDSREINDENSDEQNQEETEDLVDLIKGY